MDHSHMDHGDMGHGGGQCVTNVYFPSLPLQKSILTSGQLRCCSRGLHRICVSSFPNGAYKAPARSWHLSSQSSYLVLATKPFEASHVSMRYHIINGSKLFHHQCWPVSLMSFRFSFLSSKILLFFPASLLLKLRLSFKTLRKRNLEPHPVIHIRKNQEEKDLLVSRTHCL